MLSPQGTAATPEDLRPVEAGDAVDEKQSMARILGSVETSARPGGATRVSHVPGGQTCQGTPCSAISFSMSKRAWVSTASFPGIL